ncbi:MAG: hypothetical protein AAGL24_16035 [Pseudomonadota bacterium]
MSDQDPVATDTHRTAAALGWSVSLEAPATDATGPVSIGWLLAEQRASILFDPPTRLRTRHQKPVHPKSAAACPAVLSLDNRIFEIKCPVDLVLDYTLSDLGAPGVRNVLGSKSPVRNAALDHLIIVSPRDEWRHPDRPILQLRLPYIFLADEPVFMAQVPPFFHRPADPLPGLMIGGRFPINVWPRTLSWAFEWHETDRTLSLKRGDPLFYLQFEVPFPARPIQMVEAALTPELQAYLDAIGGVVNLVDQTFSLFEAAEKRRPSRLLEPVRR